ncbi:MAG: DNA alkylation repair protein [Nanoarchaeota archaeon]
MDDIIRALEDVARPEKVAILLSFFKTGKGQYGEGDVFIGVAVPDQRKVASQFMDISLDEVAWLLASKVHEHRLTGALILVEKFKKADRIRREEVFDFYIRNIKGINNWDIVDLTAPSIVGAFLLDRPRGLLFKMARSSNLWERRIAVVSTYTFIRNSQFDDTLKISEILLEDKHDLIHKACGWMLREVGKKDEKVLKGFLNKHATTMPRTMLRYAIERLDAPSRSKFMARPGRGA